MKTPGITIAMHARRIANAAKRIKEAREDLAFASLFHDDEARGMKSEAREALEAAIRAHRIAYNEARGIARKFHARKGA